MALTPWSTVSCSVRRQKIVSVSKAFKFFLISHDSTIFTENLYTFGPMNNKYSASQYRLLPAAPFVRPARTELPKGRLGWFMSKAVSCVPWIGVMMAKRSGWD